MTIRFSELTLGVGLGLGYLTSLRFFGPVGLSELLIFTTVLLLFMNSGKSVFGFEYSLRGAVKIYILCVLFLQLPLVTSVTFLLSEFNSSPRYVVSFIMGGLLMFLIVESLKKNVLCLEKVTVYFFYVFIFTNLFTIFFFPSSIERARYEGGAENPNQLLFYASSLSLMLVIYQKKLAFWGLPIITWIMLKTGSDAYILTLFVSVIGYLFLTIFFYGKIKFYLKVWISLFVIFILIFMVITQYFDVVKQIWLAADEGGARSGLMLNGLKVVLSSPFLGWGAGSFSGVQSPFSVSEAHSTPIDLAMQFGILLPAIVYVVMIVFFFLKLKNREFFQAAFTAAFIVSGLFHFTARHFSFWVEFAIFYYYVFYTNSVNKPKIG